MNSEEKGEEKMDRLAVNAEESFESGEAKPAVIVEEKPPTPMKQNVDLIPVSSAGKLLPTNQVQLDRMLRALLQGGGFPKQLDTLEKARMAWQATLSMGLDPMTAIGNVAVINGNWSIFGELPKALCERTGELVECDEYLIDKEYKRISVENKNLDAPLFAAVCEIQRKGRGKKTFHFTVAEAKTAGLWDKKGYNGKETPWQTFPQTMMLRRVRSIALKTEFADAVKGVSILEYDHHGMQSADGAIEVPSREVNSLSEELSQKFLDVKKPEVPAGN